VRGAAGAGRAGGGDPLGRAGAGRRARPRDPRSSRARGGRVTMPFAELVVRILAAWFLAGGLFLAAYVAPGRLLPRAPTLVRWSGAILAGMWLASVGFQLLARVGLYVLPAALVRPAALAPPALGPPAARNALRAWLPAAPSAS